MRARWHRGPNFKAPQKDFFSKLCDAIALMFRIVMGAEDIGQNHLSGEMLPSIGVHDPHTRAKALFAPDHRVGRIVRMGNA